MRERVGLEVECKNSLDHPGYYRMAVAIGQRARRVAIVFLHIAEEQKTGIVFIVSLTKGVNT